MGRINYHTEKGLVMSLFKQLAIMLTLFLAVILTSVMVLNFKTASEFIQNQLYTDAKNTAHSLGLSLSKVADPNDTSTMDTMINAIFDSGYYERIVLKNLDGKILYERKTDLKVHDVPQWFIDHVVIHNANASTDIMIGWSRFGSLEVSGHTGNAYRQLYLTFMDLLKTFVSIGAVVFGVLYLLLSVSLQSLKGIRAQARAIIDNQFIFEDKIPFTTEFRSVTVAMNAMVAKVKDIFDRENETLRRYHELLYIDSETKLHNRRYLVATLPDCLSLSSGTYVMFSFEDIDRLKRELGYEQYVKAISYFAKIFNQTFEKHPMTLIARLNESDFFAVVPNVETNEIHDRLSVVMDEMKLMIKNTDENLTDYIMLGCAIGKYADYDNIKSLFSRADHVVTQAKMVGNFTVQLCIECDEGLILGRDEWRHELMHSVEESRLLLASQPVIQQHDGQQKIIHEEIFLRYKDKEGTIHNAGFFIPIATSLGIVDILDRYMIEKVLERLSNGSIRTSAALNLSAEFIKKYDNVEWLKGQLESFHRLHKTLLWFEVSNLIALNDLEAVRTVCMMVKSFGYKFGIDHFVLPASGAGYLQIIRPDYVKSNSAYLKDILGDRQSGEARESLMNVVISLGISMIAIAVEDSEQIAHFSQHGIERYQGSAIAPVALL